MILGVGTDIVEMERIERACQKKSFLERIYTKEECRQSEGRISRYAGDFAVKEAVAKVLGTGFRSFMPADIEVLRDGVGKPYVKLYGGAQKRAQEMGITRIEVSISNTKELAIGFAVGEGEQCEISGECRTDEGD